MNDSVFLDTNGLIALLNADDGLHEAAAILLRGFGTSGRQLITTDWVIAETGNGLARLPIRRAFVQAVGLLLDSPKTTLVRIDQDFFGRALAIYSATQDKAWGLVDCASFEVMTQHGVRDALTSDRHFAQAGFNCLLSDG
jgi:predicted nucleic acid-binding protein